MLIGNKVQILPSCHSTNEYLKDKSKQERVNGEVVCALSQYNGRGQRGNTWESEPNKNLTFSFYLEPLYVLVDKQFSLNYFVSLAVYDFLKQFLPAENKLRLKWPNDIYYDKKKISGILIENHVKRGVVESCIVGIGININQTKFENLGASSVALLSGEEYSIQESLGFMLKALNSNYKNLLNPDINIKEIYLNKLLGFQKERVFLDNLLKENFIGKIVNVEDSGALVIETDTEKRKFGLKELTFCF